MRRPRPRRARAALAVLTTLAATALSIGAAAAPASAAPAPTKEVTYHGYQVRVPSSWPVVNLAAHPDTCVRLDRHAVYLGHPTAAGQATCPSNLVGRTDALLVEPLDGTSRPLVDRYTRVAPTGRATTSPLRTAGAPAGQIRLAVPSAGVLVTASYGTNPATVEHLLQGGRIGAGATAASLGDARSSVAPKTAAGVPAQPGSYTGEGFDPCAAPSTAQMTAWGASPTRPSGSTSAATAPPAHSPT